MYYQHFTSNQWAETWVTWQENGPDIIQYPCSPLLKFEINKVFDFTSWAEWSAQTCPEAFAWSVLTGLYKCLKSEDLHTEICVMALVPKQRIKFQYRLGPPGSKENWMFISQASMQKCHARCNCRQPESLENRWLTIASIHSSLLFWIPLSKLLKFCLWLLNG